MTGVNFKDIVLTCDLQNIVALAADKGAHREALHVFNVKTGLCTSKISLKVPGVRVSGFHFCSH